jgi:hypothetical protein
MFLVVLLLLAGCAMPASERTEQQDMDRISYHAVN